MLINHFEAETQYGFQGLVDQNNQKPKSPKNHIFRKKHFFLRVPALTTIDNEGHK